ncbi:flagellar hook-length control protein FliK [Dyella sp. C9]|uniref:flagellar hook-length control protein FliK n=1 Tax=Dyella sp. C9 TaxID=2202154 RepID=UPI000DEF6E8F|nr:flagellar hook-length control protein FliK [Dyella sp. C9]
MTPSLALLVNTPPSTSSSPAPSSGSASDSSSSDFSTPLRQAYQQQAAQQASSQQPSTTQSGASRPSAQRTAHGSSSSTNNTSSAQASGTAQSAATALDAASDAQGKGSVWNPVQAQGTQKDGDKAAATDPNAPQDPATAMLALLGQSIPAQAAPAPAPAGAAPNATVAATGTTGITTTVKATAGMPADADDLLDAAKAGDDDGNAALDALADDAGDDAANAGSALGAEVKLLATATQGSQPAQSSGTHGNPLDALGVVTAPMMQAQANAAQAAPAHALAMQSSVGTPAFAQELGQQVAWLGGQEIKQARITLHPEDLGPLDVKVSVQQTHVDVSFIAQHPNAVHAVQQTLSQLDSMLAHHGLTLGQAQVGQGSSGQNTSDGQASAGSANSADGQASDSGDLASVAAPVVQAVGLLDMFA